MKITSFVICLMFLFCGCQSNVMITKKTEKPKISVLWRYNENNHTIEFTVVNFSDESILLQTPFEENGVFKIDYEILDSNLHELEIRRGVSGAPVYEMIGGYPFNKNNVFSPGQTDSFIVPNAPKTFKEVLKIEVTVYAIKVSQLSTVGKAHAYKDFKDLFSYKNRQTFVVDFMKIGHKKKSGEMKQIYPL